MDNSAWVRDPGIAIPGSVASQSFQTDTALDKQLLKRAEKEIK